MPVLHHVALPSPRTPMLSPPALLSCFLQGHKGIMGPLGPPGPKGEKVGVWWWEAAAPLYPGRQEQAPGALWLRQRRELLAGSPLLTAAANQGAGAIRPPFNTDVSGVISVSGTGAQTSVT